MVPTDIVMSVLWKTTVSQPTVTDKGQCTANAQNNSKRETLKHSLHNMEVCQATKRKHSLPYHSFIHSSKVSELGPVLLLFAFMSF